MISYLNFIKHAEKVAKKAPKTRPVLRGLKLFNDGSAVVTDSHRLYFIENVHSGGESVTDLFSGEEIQGTYPDVHKLIPDDSDSQLEADLPLKLLLHAADTIARAGKLVSKEPILTLSRDEIQFKSDEFLISYSISLDLDGEVYLNSIYLADALKLFKTGNFEIVTFRYYGNLRPVKLSAGNLTVIILPVRKGW